MARLGLGLIGCGGIARSAHLPAMAALASRVVLRAAADPDLDAARRAAEPWSAEAFADWPAVLADPDVQAVVIASPEFFHPDQVVAAAEAGKHVLCEKPMARSLAEADRMIGACARAGVHLIIGHSRRFTRRYLAVREALDRGEIGTVRLFRENERRARTKPQVWWVPGHWTGDPAISGGAPMMNAIHETDLMRWFVGAQPETVTAEIGVTIEGNVGVPDFISLSVRFAGGAIGSAEILNCAPPGYPAFHQLELYGTEGAIRARDHELTELVRFSEGGADFPGHYEMLLHNLPAYARELEELVNAIEEERPVRMPPSEARAALQLALAAVRSAREGRTVRVQDEVPA